ncbi:MAG: xanthine dehydrogenase family protein molybdopterin-binding subunit [Rubrivivax sp.]|nr:xanthine dehydrogenase family protein molybdopterin-binding subunit [Rubrivivax sp.]
MSARGSSGRGLTRRGLLVGGGALLVAFQPGCALPVIPRRPAPDLEAAAGWIAHAGGRYTLVLPRVEMGQGVLTALHQVACEELGIGWDALQTRLHDSASLPPVRATVGSESVQAYALPLAQACATLRDAVARGQAGGRLVVQPRPIEALRFMRRGGAQVGRSPPPLQGRAIVTGAPLYAADQRPPGLLFGRVLRAPVVPELRSRLRAFDAAAARAVPGFVALVQDDALRLGAAPGLGIVARTPGALDRIAAALAPQWEVDGGFDAATVDALLDIDARLARGRPAHAVVREPLPDGGARWDVDLRFDIPAAAHGAIEPRAAGARVAEGRATLWAGTQDVFYVRDVVARRLGLDEAAVTVHGCRVGGAFGGRTLCTVELEAALLARAADAPVKVQWTRAQELAQGFHRPPSSHRVRVRLAGTRVVAWQHAQASGHILLTNAALPPWLQRIASLRGDGGVARGALPPYRLGARDIGFDLVRLPVFTGPWRGLGAAANGFVVESAIDACARAAGVDPLAFRLAHADDPRLARVLQRVAALAGWAAPRAAPPAGVRRGRGIAGGVYKGASWAAVVADVEIAADAAVRCTALWCVHDGGRVIHPGLVRAQCEGNLVWGLSMLWCDALPIADSRVAATGFDAAPVPRLADVPPMRVELVDGDEPPGGAGETAIVCAAAALANALTDASGRRPLRLPLPGAPVPRWPA